MKVRDVGDHANLLVPVPVQFHLRNPRLDVVTGVTRGGGEGAREWDCSHVDLFTTLDGVAQIRGDLEEDPAEDFACGGWQALLVDEFFGGHRCRRAGVWGGNRGGGGIDALAGPCLPVSSIQ